MKRLLAMAGAMAMLASLATGGRGNFVVHFDRDGNPQELLMSAGACRHHLKAHDSDFVQGVSTHSYNPEDCN